MKTKLDIAFPLIISLTLVVFASIQDRKQIFIEIHYNSKPLI